MSICVRQWRHLKQVKRGGGAHTPKPLESVPPGAFALECPACPHPGRNLPTNWEMAPDHKKYPLPLSSRPGSTDQLTICFRWLYSLFLAVDANFRLKLKNRKIKDLEIGSGWAYFVENVQYLQHISRSSSTTDKEVSDFLSVGF